MILGRQAGFRQVGGGRSRGVVMRKEKKGKYFRPIGQHKQRDKLFQSFTYLNFFLDSCFPQGIWMDLKPHTKALALVQLVSSL